MPVIAAQGFGKAKTRVGMPRPKKRKIEEVEATAENGAEIDNATGITGAECSALVHSSPGWFIEQIKGL